MSCKPVCQVEALRFGYSCLMDKGGVFFLQACVWVEGLCPAYSSLKIHGWGCFLQACAWVKVLLSLIIRYDGITDLYP